MSILVYMFNLNVIQIVDQTIEPIRNKLKNY